MISHGTFSRQPVADIAPMSSAEVEAAIADAERAVRDCTRRGQVRTSTDATTTPGTVERTNGDGLVHPSERLEFEAFKWGIATGFVIGLLVALIVFVAAAVLS